MNSLGLRRYFASRYQSKFHFSYDSKKFPVEVRLLKSLLDKYSEFLILEAIDQFIKEMPVDKANILYFASNKVFHNKFKQLIDLSAVIKYQRLIPLYKKEDQSKIRRLIFEYKDYLAALSLNPEDICRKKEITNELESFKYEEEVNAVERDRAESSVTI